MQIVNFEDDTSLVEVRIESSLPFPLNDFRLINILTSLDGLTGLKKVTYEANQPNTPFPYTLQINMQDGRKAKYDFITMAGVDSTYNFKLFNGAWSHSTALAIVALRKSVTECVGSHGLIFFRWDKK